LDLGVIRIELAQFGSKTNWFPMSLYFADKHPDIFQSEGRKQLLSAA
jgi:hypothetical protein